MADPDPAPGDPGEEGTEDAADADGAEIAPLGSERNALNAAFATVATASLYFAYWALSTGGRCESASPDSPRIRGPLALGAALIVGTAAAFYIWLSVFAAPATPVDTLSPFLVALAVLQLVGVGLFCLGFHRMVSVVRDRGRVLGVDDTPGPGGQTVLVFLAVSGAYIYFQPSRVFGALLTLGTLAVVVYSLQPAVNRVS